MYGSWGNLPINVNDVFRNYSFPNISGKFCASQITVSEVKNVQTQLAPGSYTYAW